MVILMNLKTYGIRYLLYICTVILLLSGCSKVESDGLTGSSSVTTEISLTSSASQVTNGSTFTVSVDVSNVTDLFGASFDLQYDKTVFSKTAITDGGFLAAPVVLSYAEDIQSGKFAVGVSSTAGTSGGRTGVSGSGTLCTITFQAISTGSAKEIKIATGSAKLSDTSLLNQTAPDIGSSVTITVN